MSTKEELEKLTVAQLKEKLKSRKMATSGAKTDLINRLYESILSEEKLLEEGPGGETIDLSNVNMDEVLGVLDDEKDTHSAASSELADKSTLEQMKNNNETFSLSIGSDEGKGILQQSPIKNLQNKNTISTSQTGTSITLNDQNNAANKEDAEKKQLPMDEAKKVQLKTAARLGVPLAGSTGGVDSVKKPIPSGLNEEELKAKRATRFGTLNETRRKSATEEDDKMLKRAERFGLPLKRNADGAASNSSANEALQKRAKRFGAMIGGSGGEQDEKKAARAKRFGNTVAT